MASIRKVKGRKKETYELDYRDPLTGVRKRKMLYCDQKTASVILKETEARLALKQFGIEHRNNKHITWNEITRKFLIHSSKTKSDKTTKRESIVLKIFSKFIGNPDIYDITASTIEEYMHHRMKIGRISPATVSIELRILKTLFNKAIKWDLIGVNPVSGITLPRQEPVRVRYLLIDEVERLLSTISDRRIHRLALLYLNTGARRSELLPPLFSWGNVDFDKRMLYLSGKGNRKRYIPMNETVYTILKSIKEEGAPVLCDLKPNTVTHKFHDYYIIAGIEKATLHSLRKTFGSLLIQSGKTDLYTVSKLLGHASIRTTEKYYVDLLDENYHQTVKHLENILPYISIEENA
ncbi:MAG: tyrosine-type recombinase/integrase [Candidatus Marinimicrobia bacterium]|nr:tyrosine-type recombinase/integrase [Candidatus Neomarinimicrobiota bacterium]